MRSSGDDVDRWRVVVDVDEHVDLPGEFLAGVEVVSGDRDPLPRRTCFGEAIGPLFRPPFRSASTHSLEDPRAEAVE